MTTVLCPRHAGSVLHAGGLEVFAGSLLTECWTEGSTLSLLSSEASFFWVGGFPSPTSRHRSGPGAHLGHPEITVHWQWLRMAPQLPPWAWQRSLTLSGWHRGICLGPIVSALCLHSPILVSGLK